MKSLLQKYNNEGVTLKQKKLKVRLCWGDNPPCLEIIIKKGKETDTALFLDVEKLKTFITK